MPDENKCPPHNYVTIAETRDSNGNITRVTQECNKCQDTRYL